MTNDIYLIKNFNTLFKKKVVLYGVSELGKKVNKVLKEMQVKVFAFCDGDSTKWGNELEGIKIISSDVLSNLNQDGNICVIISSTYIDEILIVLEEVGIENIFTEFGLKCAIDANIDSKFLPEDFKLNYTYKRRLWEIDREEMRNSKKFQLQGWKYAADENANRMSYAPANVGGSWISRGISKQNHPEYLLHYLNSDLYFLEGEFKDTLKYFENILLTKRNKITTGVREPIAEQLAIFMTKVMTFGLKMPQDLIGDFQHYLIEVANGEERLSKKCTSIHDVDDYTFFHMAEKNEFEWFNMELKQVLGIDVYQYPFDKEKGYTIIRKGNTEVMVYQLEKQFELEDEFKKFLELPSFKIERALTIADLEYHQLYKELKERIVLTSECVDCFYKNNSQMNHFYSEKDQKEFLKRWEPRIVDKMSN